MCRGEVEKKEEQAHKRGHHTCGPRGEGSVPGEVLHFGSLVCRYVVRVGKQAQRQEFVFRRGKDGLREEYIGIPIYLNRSTQPSF